MIGTSEEDDIPLSVRQIMKDAGQTYQERRDQYGPSEVLWADIMMRLFPNGPPDLQDKNDWIRWGLFVQIVSKLARYANDFNTPHVDSVHDLGVYSFMLESYDRLR